jgi:hypothetical protein
MKLLLLLLILLLLSIILKKYKKLLVLFSVLFIISFYFFLSANFFYRESFYPKKNINYYNLCCNYYNLLTDSLKKHQLNFLADKKIDYENYHFYINSNQLILLDTSVYKNKIYLYFGITPVLLFYLPFNLITGLYLTDKFIVFILSCFIFLISLFIVKKILESITETKNIPVNLIILSIFLIGICNLLPFLVIRTAIYEVAITTAIFLLLITFCSFYYYITTKNLKIKYILTFCISLTLCLTVGARPHYILFIPIFFFAVICLQLKEKNNLKSIINSVIIFLIPCLIYGTILALYNYLRFDSIFEFGWKYQINPQNQAKFIPSIKDFIICLQNNFFLVPNINDTTIFSLTETSGHSIGNEYVTGIVWTCPVILILLFIPHFLKRIYKENSNTFIFILTLLLVTTVNIITLNFFGMLLRYIFEYLCLMIILSVLIFLFYISRIKDKLLKNFFNIIFMFIFVYSVFINISLLFCKENAISYLIDENLITNYTKIVMFLF